jgi:hypothetical protein
MGTFIYYAVPLLDIAWLYIYIRIVGRFYQKKKSCSGGVFYEALMFLLVLFPWALLLLAAMSCHSAPFFKASLLFHGLFFMVFALVIIVSLFIERRKGLFLNVLKAVTADMGNKRVLIFSVFSVLWGVSTICALLVFDFPAQAPSCHSLRLALKG